MTLPPEWYRIRALNAPVLATDPLFTRIVAKWDGERWLVPDRLIELPREQVLEVLEEKR